MARRLSAWMATVGCVASLLAAPSAASGQCTISVTASAASVAWNDPATWTPSRVPGATDRACVPPREGDQTVVVTTSESVLSLESDEGVRVQFGRLNVAEPSRVQRLELSGDLGGAGTIDIPGSLAWTSGRMDGAGTTRVTGQATLTGSLLTLGDTRRLRNEGTLTVADGIGLHPGFQAAPRLENAGAITKPEGTATTFLDVPMTLGGTVTAGAGTLRLGGGGTVSGRVAGEEDGRVEFGVADYPLTNGAELAGRVRLATARLIVSGVATASGAFEQAGGSIAGDGTLDVTGTLSWSGGTMDGSGTTRLRGAASITGAFLSISGTRRVRNEGTLTLGDGASIASAVGAIPVLENLGTVSKPSGSGTAFIALPLDGGGTYRVDAGTLEMSSFGASPGSSGHFSAAPGAELRFTGEPVLATGARLGDGVNLRTSQLELAGDATVSGTVRLDGGIAGPGDLRVTGSLNWLSGNVRGDGLLAIAPGGTLLIQPAFFAGTARPLRNDGEVTWASGDLNLEHGGLIDNRGTFTAVSPGWISATLPSETAIRNTGTLIVAISGAPIFWPPLENDGVLVLRSGTLELREPLTQTIDGELRFERAGLLDARAGARLQGTLRATGATFQSGDRLPFLRYPSGGLRGRFDRVLGNGALTFAVEYDATEARLAVSGPPLVEPLAEAAPARFVANRAPLARGERLRTAAGRRVRLRLLANDRDPDGDRLRVVVLSGPRGVRGGVLTLRVRRTTRVRYVVVDPSGARSAAVTAKITVRR
jgi:hypothetical protein